MRPVVDPHHAPPRPWHREPWPWILASLPLAAVVAGIITLVIAMKHEDGLVAQDYYKRGLEINRVLEKEARAATLGIRAQLAFGGGRVSALLEQPRPPPPVLALRFLHRTRTGEDRQVALALDSAGRYQADMPALARGRWLLQLEDPQLGWRLAGTWWTDDATLGLTPASASLEDK
jgi:hypothetical protein